MLEIFQIVRYGKWNSDNKDNNTDIFCYFAATNALHCGRSRMKVTALVSLSKQSSNEKQTVLPA